MTSALDGRKKNELAVTGALRRLSIYQNGMSLADLGLEVWWRTFRHRGRSSLGSTLSARSWLVSGKELYIVTNRRTH